ncbi:MAG: PASTA domain-containing protein [Ruminococcaceae bacterium]|nr:PASTA domain-containing protein [Oscillospiraceae bacterium]
MAVAKRLNRIDKKTTTRLGIVFCFFLAICTVIVAYLANYQLKMNEYYQSQVLNQLTIQTEVNPERGSILDRNGNILAANITVYNVILSPQHIIEAMEEDEAANSDSKADNDVLYEFSDPEYGLTYKGTRQNELIAKVLSAYLEVDYDRIIEKAAKVGRRYEVIKNNVDDVTAEKIKAFIAEFGLKNQIYFTAGAKRYYPKSDLASHVIGFTNSEGVGIYGLEQYYNNILEGTSGRYILAQDARNNDMPFEYERYIEASNGYNLVTTIDIYIQYELENQLEKTFIESGAQNRVSGIVMDVNTGEILAMATYPSFDLNSPYVLDDFSAAKLQGVDEKSEEYNELYWELLYTMWNNKAITETYEPGSTFKIVTTSMAFEEKVVSPDSPFFCGGSYKIEGWSKPISCHYKAGHGNVTFTVGLQQSCNPVLMQIAERVGREKFYNYFEAFGYTEKTGIDLPGEVGGIYSSYKNFSNVSLAVYSFGQTFKTTPIQQVRAVSAVANGGTLVTPHLIKEIVDDDGNVIQSFETEAVRQVVSSATCETITDILEEGVAGDGGAKNAYVKGYRVAAKTGTSEKRDKYDENGNTPWRVGSCVAYAPADSPEVAALIMVDEPSISSVYGSVVAAPYISNLMGFVLPYIGVEAQYTSEELENLDITLSNYVGASVENCIRDLSWRGFTYEIIGSGDTVTAQIPEAGTMISSDSGILLLYTGDEAPANTITVPNVVGMSAYNANQTLVNLGLNVSFAGSVNGSSATVISQTPAANTMVSRGTVVEVTLRHLDMTD